MKVLSLHRKPKTTGERGIPKPAFDELTVTVAGVDGDYNRYRSESCDGDPDHAVLILPTEIIRTLNEEGWAVAPGDLGENITTEGVEEFAPGTRLSIGEVVLEISEPCVPCSNLRILPYVGPTKQKAFIQTLLGRRGDYARVLGGGTIRLGDAITVRVPSSSSRTSG